MSGPIAYTTLEDTELVARAREGDSRAFDELVIRHSRKLHATLYQMTDNYDDSNSCSLHLLQFCRNPI